MDITGNNLSVDAIQTFIEEQSKEKAEKRQEKERKAKAEREKLHQAFMEREVPADAMDHVATMVRRAVEAGEEQVLLFQFPSDWLPDQGRSITNHADDWPAHLSGFAQRAYAYFEQKLKARGFALRAEILDWTGGIPGDVGFFLKWKQMKGM